MEMKRRRGGWGAVIIHGGGGGGGDDKEDETPAPSSPSLHPLSVSPSPAPDLRPHSLSLWSLCKPSTLIGSSADCLPTHFEFFLQTHSRKFFGGQAWSPTGAVVPGNPGRGWFQELSLPPLLELAHSTHTGGCLCAQNRSSQLALGQGGWLLEDPALAHKVIGPCVSEGHPLPRT